MIRHLFRLVWNRKKTHALIMLEILLSFVVVFALLASTIHFTTLYRQPLGYDYENVWVVEVDRETGQFAWEPEEARQFRRLRHELEALPETLHVATASNYPFSGSMDRWGWDQDGHLVQPEGIQASVSYIDALDIQLLAGRWFETADDALEWTPLVIDTHLSREMFGDEDPLGRLVADGADVEKRVVGLIDTFRRGGHLADVKGMMFTPVHEEQDDGYATIYFVLKVAPGTTAQFEEAMVGKLQSGAPGWTFSVELLEEVRRSDLTQQLVPLAVFGTVGVFLLIMVVLGLTGVMWQNVTRRTREIGLRRAAGASRASVHRQIVMEVMIIATFGVAIGAAIAMQVPFVGPFSFLPVATAAQAVLGATVTILLLAGLCGLYPGMSATRIQPAEALHYE